MLLTNNKDETKEITSSLMILCTVLSGIFLVICIVFNASIEQVTNLSSKYLILMAIYIISEEIIQFWCVPKRFEYEYKIYILVFVSLFAFKCLFSIVFSWLLVKDRVLGRIIGLCVPSVVYAMPLFIKNVKGLEIKCIVGYWKYALLFNMPLIPHYLTSILMSSADKIMIQKITGDLDTGLYAVAYSYSSLVLVFFSSINSAYTPYALKRIRNHEYEDLSKVTNMVVTLSVCVAAFMILLAPEGLMLLAGRRYFIVAGLVPVLVIGIFFSSFYFIFSNIEFVYEKNKYIFPITLLGTIINILSNLYLIPRNGYIVAAYTTLVSYFFIFIAHYYVSKAIIREGVYDIRFIIILIGLLTFLGIGSMFLYGFDSVYRYIIVGILFVVLIMGLLKYKIVFYNLYIT